eukprot:15446951-Alexandrium_andersonii.AAC.1
MGEGGVQEEGNSESHSESTASPHHSFFVWPSSRGDLMTSWVQGVRLSARCALGASACAPCRLAGALTRTRAGVVAWGSAQGSRCVQLWPPVRPEDIRMLLTPAQGAIGGFRAGDCGWP